MGAPWNQQDEGESLRLLDVVVQRKIPVGYGKWTQVI
jgi:hypothetical protein